MKKHTTISITGHPRKMFKGFHPEIRKPIKNVCTPPVAFQNRKLSEILLSSSLLAVDTPHPVSGSWPVYF